MIIQLNKLFKIFFNIYYSSWKCKLSEIAWDKESCYAIVQINNKNIYSKILLSKLISSNLINLLPSKDVLLCGIIYSSNQSVKISADENALDYIRNNLNFELKNLKIDINKVTCDFINQRYTITANSKTFNVKFSDFFNNYNLLSLLPTVEQLNLGFLIGQQKWEII